MFLSRYITPNALSRAVRQIQQRNIFTSQQYLCSSKIPESLWKLGRLNHIAIATNDLEKSTSLYR